MYAEKSGLAFSSSSSNNKSSGFNSLFGLKKSIDLNKTLNEFLRDIIKNFEKLA